MKGKKLNLRHGGVCRVRLEGLPRNGVYAGYNINEDAYIVLVRNPHDPQDIIPLKSQDLKSGEEVSHLNKILTSAENELANNWFEHAGI